MNAKEKAFEAVDKKFRELESIISDSLEVQADFKTKIQDVNRRLLNVKGELAMALAVYKTTK